MIYIVAYAGICLLRIANARALYPALIAMLFLFSAFRFEVGCDWTGYINQFVSFKTLSLSDAFQQREPLWTSLFALQSWLDLPYPWINVASSAIFFFGVDRLARRQPDPLAFLILLFPVLILNMPMSGIRQAAAIGMMCIAYGAFIDRKLLIFVAVTLVATGLHSSAIVFLLLAPLVNGNFSKARLALAGALAIPGALALLSTSAAETATSRYVETGVDAAGAAFRVGLLTLTAGLYFLRLRRPWAEAFPRDLKLVTIGCLAMLAITFLVPVSSVIGDRLGYYFVPIQAMIFARLPFLKLMGSRQALIAAPYVGLLVVLTAWVSLSLLFDRCYLPYQTWLFGFPLARYAF